MTRILPADLDVVARDFDSLRERAVRCIASVHPDWSDTTIANFANLLMEMGPHIGDVLDKYRSAQFGESFFTTCTRRINGVRHGRAFGYRFSRQAAASADVVITLINGPYNDIPLTSGMVVSSASATNPARFQMLADYTIPAGVASYSVGVENSLTHQHSFTSTDLADQRQVLPQSPFLEIVSMGDEVYPVGGSPEWSEQDSFFASGPTDPHYQVLLSDGDRGLVRYGDNNQGRIPSGLTEIEYKTGGGAIVVDAGTLTVPEFSLEDIDGKAVVFTITNPAAASGGLARETLAHAQEALPAQLTVNGRSVAQPDYGTNAERVSGICKAVMLTADQMEGIPENYGYLYVVARGSQLSSGGYAPTTASAVQKAAVRSIIEDTYKPTITFEYSVSDPAEVEFDITARVRLDQGAVPATVDAAIRSNLADYFAVEIVDPDDSSSVIANPNFLFGWEMKDELGEVRNKIAWSWLFDVVNDTTGVSEVDKSSFIPYASTTLPYNAIPVLGTVTLINDRTGLSLV